MGMERRGHAEFDSFDRKVRQGGMTKPSVKLQELRRKIYRKAKAEEQWRFCDETEGPPGLWLEEME
jgi:hypothetical protein